VEVTRRHRPSVAPDVADIEPRDEAGDDHDLVAARAKTARRIWRYTRIARVLSVVLAIVALLTLVVVLIWPQIQPRMDRLRIGMASLDVLESDGEGLVNAKLSGNDDKGRPYVITADFVRQLQGGTGVLGLDRPRGEITMEDGSKTVLTAAAGTFDQDKRLLKLYDGVVLTTGDGARYETAAADIDLAAGTANGTDPVQGRGPMGTVSGEGFHATDFGQTIFIDGRSTLVVAEPAQAKPS
jgi:lipopolysaccharide export system protein LptC